MNARKTLVLCLLGAVCSGTGFSQQLARTIPALGIWAEAPAVLKSDQKLRCVFLTTNVQGTIIFLPLPQYFCRVSLVDEKGLNVPATNAGAALGERFDDIKEFSYSKIVWQSRKGSDPRRPMGVRLWSDKAAGKEELPAVDEMFEVRKAGHYQLTVQIQVFEQTGAAPKFSRKLVKLNPLVISVLKGPDDRKGEHRS